MNPNIPPGPGPGAAVPGGPPMNSGPGMTMAPSMPGGPPMSMAGPMQGNRQSMSMSSPNPMPNGPMMPMQGGPPMSMSSPHMPGGPPMPSQMSGGPPMSMAGGPPMSMPGPPMSSMSGGPPMSMPGGPPMPGGPMPGGPPMSVPGGPPMSMPSGPMPGGPPMMMHGGPGGPMPMPGGGPMPGQDPFYSSPFSTPFYRRPTPYMGQPDYRIYELNKRLQHRTEDSDNLWWDTFTTEFFEDDAQLTLTFCLEDGPKRYTIGRTLIPRYFRSIFEGGVSDLHYVLKYPKESFHNTTITLDCDHALMVTQHGKPMFTNVITEGRLILEFTFDDLMRIRSWHFAIRQHRELIPRSVIGMQQDPTLVEQLSKNITRMGLTTCTLNFMRLCVILEPMQELMSRHKAYGLQPRDCLKTTLFQKWQRMVAPPGKESSRPPSKRRKRKASAGNNSGPGAMNNRDAPPSNKQKRSPGPQAFNLGSTVPGDVMVVGEPTLMGGEFGDEDERLITRLENSQFEPTNNDDGTGADKFHNSPAVQQGGWNSGDKTNTQPSSSATATPTTNTQLTEAEIKQE